MGRARLEDLAHGAIAGTIATLAHTAVMGIASRRGKLGEPPPKKITRASAKAVAPGIAADETALNLATVAMHVGFGAAMGALYAGMHPRERALTLRSGLVFGSAVWAASYLGWVPALGIMPMPHRDRPGRPTAMIGAHWAYGGTLAIALRALRRR